MRLLVGSFLECCLCAALIGISPKVSAAGDDLGQGRRLYQEHCGICHGAHGDDGFGANLAVPKLPHAPDDQSLARLIKQGFEGTEMPAAFGVTDTEVHQIIIYVRTLGRASQQNVPGNPFQGEQLFRTKGNCGQCHMLAGQGGRQGPDLTDIGLRRSPAQLRESLLNPEAALPHQFLLVEVTSKDGHKISGIRLNEDSLSIQVRSRDDMLHSFWKSELAEVRKEFGKSSMPSYRDVFSEAEFDDLVAFLVSLRGSQ